MRASVSVFAAFVAWLVAPPASAAYISTTAPAAFYVFCAKNPASCQARGRSTAAMPMTAARWSELRSVNDNVNRAIREITDEQLHGVPDVWSIPTGGAGDCEDFALTKQRDLIAAGWPSSVLLVTVVRNRQGEGHAVLTVVTSEGDFILDNQTGSILPSSRSGLTFYSRQSPANPRSWVVVDRDGTVPGGSPAVVSKVDK